MGSLGKKMLVYGICSMLGSPFMVMPSTTFAGHVKDVPVKSEFTVYQGGTIYTMQETMKEVSENVAPKKADVVVVKDDKIVYVGNKEGAKQYLSNPKAKKVDLGNKVMLPGFVDPHGHFPSPIYVQKIDLSPSPIQDKGGNTLKEIQEKLIEKAHERDYAGNNIQWIDGEGYDDTMLDIHRHPSHQELSEGELGKYFVLIRHLSGHMFCVNTKALRRMFETDYIQNELTKAIFDQGLITKDRKGVSAKLIKNADGSIQYQVTLDDNSTIILPGIQMTADAAKKWKPQMTVEESLACMTGLLQERAMFWLVRRTNETGYVLKAGEEYSVASKEYASRGVTTADSGASLLLLTQPTAQAALLQGKLKTRLVIQPVVYSTIGSAIAESTLLNHYSLAWENTVTTGDEKDRKIGNPSATSPKIGQDITTWDVGNGTKAKLGSNAPAGSLGEKLQQQGIKDYLFLGSWKYIYDGSIQGYTGYLSQKGYYKKPEEMAQPFNPAGRTGDAKKNHADYVRGGTVTVSDPQFFCTAGDHYGNENAILGGSYNIGEKTIMDYHSQAQGVAMHLNGSWANDDVVNFIEKAVQKNPNIVDTRHTIIHAQMQELQHIQRFMGNYDSFPIKTADEVKRFGSVWTGVNAMKWQEDPVQKDEIVGKNYNPVEGKYKIEFSDEAKKLRQDLKSGEQSLMRKQNIISSYFVDHVFYWGDRHRDIFMGPGRAYNMSPMGWAVKLGHRFTAHNDTPVTPMNPLKTITIATTRMSSGVQAGGVHGTPQPIYGTPGVKDFGKTKWYPATVEDGKKNELTEFHDFDQRITVLQALHSVTTNGAYQHKLEDKVGQIKEGLLADFVILGQDPYQLEKEGRQSAIANIPVVATIVGNEVVFGFLPGTEAGDFVGEVEPSFYNKDDADTTITNLKEEPILPTDEEAMKAEAGNAFFGATQFTAEIAKPNKIGVFSLQIMGNNRPVNTLHVMKYKSSTDSLPYKFVEKANINTEGLYWVTDTFQEKQLGLSDVLEAGKAYYIHFTVMDNGKYDLNSAEKLIKDPMYVYSDTLPQEASSGAFFIDDDNSGCSIGTNAMYDFAALLFIALGLVGIRLYYNRQD